MIVLTKYAIPHMKRGSSIVNSTSVTAYKGVWELTKNGAVGLS
jgi:NAD(P)-dependent dehydrogenase (short-subunit alcohol dehydrogenase family)